MVVTFPASQSGNGLRPIDPGKDLPQLVELLRLAFGKEMEAEGKPVFRSAMDSQTPAFLWRLDPALSRLAPGFVWEADDVIVGNVTLLPTHTHSRYLVANVAVHPDYRRQGIARLLMGAVREYVLRRGGREILLQVVRTNKLAIDLYGHMGYRTLGSMTTWRASVSRVRGLPEQKSDGHYGIDVQLLERKRWREAYRLDCKALAPGMNWPDPILADAYKVGLRRRIKDFLNGRYQQTWMTLDGKQLVGLAKVHGGWGRPHELSLRVHPLWQGQLERPLLNKLISRLQSMPRRNVLLVHNADDELVNQLLPNANFSRVRTLTHMRLVLNDGPK
jgi:ribosomal protein S18 acetylase RimI-like enzyme